MKLNVLALSAALLAIPVMEASAATYTYVGMWNLNDPTAYDDQNNPLLWFNNPAVYTAQEAAAFLFGGMASDYAISTAGNSAAEIDFSAWVDGWDDALTYGPLGSGPAAQDFSLDSTGLGYDGCKIQQVDCSKSSYSALVYDHFPGYNIPVINYAFRISVVPLPASGLLLLGAFAGFGWFARRRSA